MGLGDVLNGDKPLEVKFSVDIVSAMVLGLVIFIAIVAAHYSTK